MKTIAFMTMAFLPATFFAALFALPLFDWSASPVIQKRFWVYWATTLPVTLLVFIIWYIVTKRVEIYQKIENQRQRATVAKRARTARGDSGNSSKEDDSEGGQTTSRQGLWMKRVLQQHTQNTSRKDEASQGP
jgi:hypothetical protein